MSIEEYAAEQQRYQGMPIYTQSDVDKMENRIKELEEENASLRNSKETYSEMLLESIKQLAKEGM